ncbi:hypothetical protein BDZ90DRAFT_9532 [Jaminaea rosea]|uniref:Uncharacterized protein n=1 Tax=Jaminaea rosea TaxID=1569628 RepID=A0A316V4D0_9BASI|nr:hypothetical protein BDZ90DRAFT_9532 [Jaminaea rosea]PWN30305.1 hypothetical protein BDZ90DRAFT_9532 [Jaminaea rosea]
MFRKGKSARKDDRQRQRQPQPIESASPSIVGTQGAGQPAGAVRGHTAGPRDPRPNTEPAKSQQPQPQHKGEAAATQSKVSFVHQAPPKSAPGHQHPSQHQASAHRPASSPNTSRGPISSVGSGERRPYVPGAFSGRRTLMSSSSEHGGTPPSSNSGSMTLVSSHNTAVPPPHHQQQRGIMMTMSDGVGGAIPCPSPAGGYPDPFSITGVRGGDEQEKLTYAQPPTSELHVPPPSSDVHSSTSSSWVSAMSASTGIVYGGPPLGNGHGANRATNPYKINHIYDEYASLGPEDDDWLHDVKYKKIRSRKGEKKKDGAQNGGPRIEYDVDRWRWRSCCCCSCRGIGECV